MNINSEWARNSDSFRNFASATLTTQTMETDMNPFIRMTIAAVSMVTFVSMVEAQSETPPADQVDQHHVDEQPVVPDMPMVGQTGVMPGMMGSGQMMGMMGEWGYQPGMMNMDSMMQMMRQMMSMQHGGNMQPFEHVEGRIAFLRAEIKITDTQEMLWNAFADALRQAANDLRTLHIGAPQATSKMTWLDRLTLHKVMLTAKLNAVKTVESAARPLYDSFSAEQKLIADELMSGPMGMM